MKEKIRAFFDPVGEVMKRIFTPLPKSKLFKGWFLQLMRVAGFIAMVIFPFCCYFTLEFVHYASKTRFLSFIENRQSAVIFGLGIIYLIYALLLLIFKKGFIASGIMGVATVMISMANYYKYAQVGDYLYPWDIAQQMGNLGELSSFLTIPFPWWGTVLYVGLTLWYWLRCCPVLNFHCAFW